MNKTQTMSAKHIHLSITEAAPCEVAYQFEGDQQYAKLKKDDFERIIVERRQAMKLAKVWMALGLVSAVLLAGAIYSLAERTATSVVLVPPVNVK